MKRFFMLIAAVLVSGAGLYAQEKQTMKPEETEVWDPVPPVVTPGVSNATPPSDAIFLFSGKGLEKWEYEKPGSAKWLVKDGAMTVVKGAGNIKTKEVFGDFQFTRKCRHSHGLAFLDSHHAPSCCLYFCRAIQERYYSVACWIDSDRIHRVHGSLLLFCISDGSAHDNWRSFNDSHLLFVHSLSKGAQTWIHLQGSKPQACTRQTERGSADYNGDHGDWTSWPLRFNYTIWRRFRGWGRGYRSLLEPSCTLTIIWESVTGPKWLANATSAASRP